MPPTHLHHMALHAGKLLSSQAGMQQQHAPGHGSGAVDQRAGQGGRPEGLALPAEGRGRIHPAADFIRRAQQGVRVGTLRPDIARFYVTKNTWEDCYNA